MRNKKVALITGITGQDGAYLAKLLLEKGYEVYGGFPSGGDILVQPNGTIIPYGVTSSPLGSALSSFTIPQHTYNPSS